MDAMGLIPNVSERSGFVRFDGNKEALALSGGLLHGEQQTPPVMSTAWGVETLGMVSTSNDQPKVGARRPEADVVVDSMVVDEPTDGVDNKGEDKKQETENNPEAAVDCDMKESENQKPEESHSAAGTDVQMGGVGDGVNTQVDETGASGAPTSTQPQSSSSQQQSTSAPASGNVIGPKKPTRPSSDGPLYKLSVNLIHTYKHINQVYYAKKRRQEMSDPDASGDKRRKETPVYNNGFDDEFADYKVRRNEVFNEIYRLERVIGRGSFGLVVKGVNIVNNEPVAIKIIKSKKAFTQQALSEIKILKYLNSEDPTDQYNIVQLKDQFVFRNHQCLVFELLSYNLYELIRGTKFQGVSLPLVKKFAKQILIALLFCAQANIVHCDLKPENVLLRNPRRSAIKVIDYGSSCFHNERLYSYIQSRFYRSPEVLMRLGYSCAIDMWSLGCILFELHTGYALFQGKNETDMVGKIVEVLGMPEDEMISRSPKGLNHFRKKKDGSWAPRTNCTPGSRSLHQLLGVEIGGPEGRRLNEPEHSVHHYLKFKDLIEKMLVYNPHHRITPLEALSHSFFRDTANEWILTNISIPVEFPGQQQNTNSANTQAGQSASNTAAVTAATAAAGSSTSVAMEQEKAESDAQT